MSRTSRRLAALFIIGTAAFYTPLLGAFNRPGSVLGVPLLPFYLFVVWGLLVFLGWALARGDKS